MSHADPKFWAAIKALDKHAHDLRAGLYAAYLAIAKVDAERDLPKPMQAEFKEMLRVLTCKPKGGTSAALDTIEVMSIADLERMDRRLRAFASRLAATGQ